ncbi:hypothetical protein HanIR_Chr02g0074011 [Helianthus annuus]|nr:hypothetical protein HanIR_Chr02g0074011 [Helianthus annuus]
MSCSYAKLVWQILSQWCNVQSTYAFSLRYLGEKKKAFHAVILTAICHLVCGVRETIKRLIKRMRLWRKL